MRGFRASRYAVVVLTCFLCSSALYAQAERVNPYRSQVTTSGIEAAMRKPRTSAELERIPTVRLKTRIYTEGNLDVRLSHRRNKTWTSVISKNGAQKEDLITPLLLRGKIAVNGGLRMRGQHIMPAAAYAVGNTVKLSFAGKARGSRKSRQRLYTITMKLDGSLVISAKITSIPRSAVRRGACAAPTLSVGAAAHGPKIGPVVQPLEVAPRETGNDTAQVVTISTDADPEWYARYGDSSNAVIAGLVNAGEAIYARQLGIRFRIVKQHTYAQSSPYNDTDAIKLLSSFMSNTSNSTNLSDEPRNFNNLVDLKHLFTGKNFDGSVIGIAYIGVVCASPTLAYGATSHYVDAADFAIFAHEVGHNFGAYHDTENRGSLMYPSISVPAADSFSDASLGEVRDHIAQYGSCLSVEEVAPRPDITPGYPTPTTPQTPDLSSSVIRISRRRVGDPRNPVVRLSGTIVSPAGVALPGVPVRLLAAGEAVGEATSDSTGAFQFFVRLDFPENRQLYFYAETTSGEAYSNFLWLGRTKPRT